MSKKGPKANHSSKEKNKTAIYVALIGAAALIVVAIITGLFGLIPKNSQSTLEITSLTATGQSKLNVQIRNIGSAEALITELTVSIVEDPGKKASIFTPHAILYPSAQYDLAIEDLTVGESKSIQVSYVIGVNKADRFLVDLHTTRALPVRLTITYNRNQTVSETVRL